MARLIQFENILNARDFGGYSGVHGTLAMGKLLRTAHLSNASEADLDALRALNVGLIVDLRYLSERERQPNRFPAESGRDSAVKICAFDGRRKGQAPHEAFIENDLKSPDDAAQYMLGSYTDRPYEPAFVNIFSQTLKHMALTGETSLIHCAAGKDRTGTLVALIQSLLGVKREDIIADYMLTLKAVDVEAILGVFAPILSERHNRPISADLLRPMFGVREDYLQASLTAMGDPIAYAYDVLGLDKQSHERLIGHYMS